MLIVLVGMVLIFFIVDMIAKIVSPDNSLGAGIIAAGMELIVGAFPALIDNVLGLLSFQITGKQASDDVNIWSLVTGFVLLVVGILVLLFIRDRFYVLNMFGLYSQREIGDKQNVKQLKLNDYKIRERFIDFVNVFNMGIDEKTNSIIVNKIEEECTKFKDRSAEFKKGFTGTAPIPYTILAGTYLVDCEPKIFFEWKREDEKFIQLSTKKKANFPELKIKEMDNPNVNAESIIVAISTTRRIKKHQLKDFGEQDIIEIYLDDCKDNNITYIKQLQNYRRLDMKQPIITILDRLTEKIQNENKIENVQIGLFRLEVADFSEKVFQEALLNALSHRDYQQMGAVYVKHYSDKIVIENPGGFLDGITADNIITHPSAPRNKLIAETLQSLKYVQRTGQGVDIIYKEMVSMGKPYPVYRVFSDSVQLTLESAMEDPDFVRFIVKEQDSKQVSLSLSQLMILRYIVENRKIKLADVQNVAQISAEEARKCCSELMKFGLIEIIGKEYMLTARVYEAVKSDIEYTRDKTVQYIKAKDMITEYIKLQGYINRSTVQELCGFTDQQARRTIEKMKEENIIEMSNGGRYAKYILKEI